MLELRELALSTKSVESWGNLAEESGREETSWEIMPDDSSDSSVEKYFSAQ